MAASLRWQTMPPNDLSDMQMHGLPAVPQAQLARYWYPLAEHIAERQGGKLFIVGISGAQGSGKSTLARGLAWLLARRHGLRVVTLSLDDLYLSGRQRARLAARVHPLLRTRGVPGTHDLALGEQLFTRLANMAAADHIFLPCFDKASDEPVAMDDWPRWQGVADVLIFEGWCVGLPAQSATELQQPVNSLEAEHDQQGIWRAYVNQRLATDYRQLFARLDLLLYLQVPSMREAFRWRLHQEQQLPADKRMTPAQLERFMQHFERLTLHAMDCLPTRADIVFRLDEAQKIIAAFSPMVLRPRPC